MRQGKLKMWVGVGSYLLSGMASTAIATQIQPARAETIDLSAPPAFLQILAAGGEGGEGGEGTPAAGTAVYGKTFTNKMTKASLLVSLRQGGHIIYLRHAQTEKDYADQADPKLDLNNCATQRALNAKGIEQAKSIGAGIRAAKIPVGTVLASDYCRAWKTANLAFGTYKKNSALNFVKSEEYNAAQRLEMKTAVMPLLTTAPTPGTNTVIVGHDDVFDAASGFYPKPQGAAYILKPDGKGKFTIVYNMPPEGWATIAK